MGALTLKGSYNTAERSDSAGGTSENGAKTTQTAVGAVYDLSKRTALFGTYSVNKLTAGAATAGSLRATVGVFGDALTAGNSATATGIDIGVRHRF
jgi:predicted porin